MAKKTAESQFTDRLAQGDKAWKEAPVGGFKVCPVGHHTMVLEEAKIVESKQAQELFLAIKYVIRIGEHKGQKADEMFSLDNEERFGWLKGRIEDLGYEVPDSKAGIEEIAADLTREKPAVVADVSHFTSEKTGKVYANINNLVLIDNKDLAAELASEPEEEPEDEPEAEAEVDADEAEVEADGEIEVGSTVSFEDAEGDQYEGEVLEIDDEEVTVKDGDGGKWNIPLDELTLVEEEPEEGEEGEEPAEDDEQKTKLCTIADAHDCEVDEDDDVDDIIEAMKKKTWKAKKLADDEIAVLKEAGIKVVKTTAKKAAKKTAKKAAKKTAKKKGAKKR